MIKKPVAIFLVALMLAAVVAPIPAGAQKAQNGGGAGLTVPVTGRTQSGGRINGTFTIEKFVETGDRTNPVGAVGTLLLQTASGQTAVTQVTMPVQLASGGGSNTSGAISAQVVTCQILDLTLGPLDLNLLGLEIHLDQVHLTIDANPVGGLLGQLLCAIANLLGPGGIIIGSLTQLVALLNQLIALLGGLGL
jgi:hypothetical protein